MAVEKRKGYRGVLVALLVAALLPIYKTLVHSKHPIAYLLPNALLYTGFRTLTRSLWENIRVIDTSVTYEPKHIPIVHSYAELEAATEGWLRPAIVRGLFSDTPAMTKWQDPNYLPKGILGERQVPVVRSAVVNTLQNDRYVGSFHDAYSDILLNDSSLQYLFFPVMSRFHYSHSELAIIKSLQDDVNELVREDLKIEEKLWKGFGSATHTTYRGAQIIAGRGKADSIETTGTGWHCAIGSNYFVQVAGRKRWFFMHPKHSAQMLPLRHGLHTMATGDKDMASWHNHLPVEFCDLEAGDMLYNPDWYWHSIQNYAGLSVGVPMREANFSLSFKSNLHFSTIVAVNKLMQAVGFDIGGYAPAAGKDV